MFKKITNDLNIVEKKVLSEKIDSIAMGSIKIRFF